MRAGVFAMVLVGLSTQAMAQETYHWPAPARPADPGFTYFPMGTPIVLRTRAEVNTKQAKPGDRVYLEVVESLMYRGQIVVPAGAPAVAEVARSERNGHFGKRGEIVVRLLYVETPHGRARLTGMATHRGKSGTAASIATMTLVSPLGFLIHGTSGRLPFGTAVTAYLDEALRFVSTPVQAEVAAVRPLPSRFDPSVFGGSGPGFSQP